MEKFIESQRRGYYQKLNNNQKKNNRTKKLSGTIWQSCHCLSRIQSGKGDENRSPEKTPDAHFYITISQWLNEIQFTNYFFLSVHLATLPLTVLDFFLNACVCVSRSCIFSLFQSSICFISVRSTHKRSAQPRCARASVFAPRSSCTICWPVVTVHQG